MEYSPDLTIAHEIVNDFSHGLPEFRKIISTEGFLRDFAANRGACLAGGGPVVGWRLSNARRDGRTGPWTELQPGKKRARPGNRERSPDLVAKRGAARIRTGGGGFAIRCLSHLATAPFPENAREHLAPCPEPTPEGPDFIRYQVGKQARKPCAHLPISRLPPLLPGKKTGKCHNRQLQDY